MYSWNLCEIRTLFSFLFSSIKFYHTKSHLLSCTKMQQKNNDSENERNYQITRIIQENYNEQQQKLNLYALEGIWIDVLDEKDWSALKILEAAGCEIDGQNIKILVMKQWGSLERLDLGENKVEGSGLRELINKTPQLRILELYETNIGNDGMDFLLKTDKLPKLQQLYVQISQIDASGLKDAPNFITNLRVLALDYNNIGSTGVKLFVKSSMQFLRELWLADCKVGSEGAKHLTKGNWPNLTYLKFGDNGISLEGYQSLMKNCWAKLLKFQTAFYEKMSPIFLLCFLQLNGMEQLLINYNMGFDRLKEDPQSAASPWFEQE